MKEMRANQSCTLPINLIVKLNEEVENLEITKSKFIENVLVDYFKSKEKKD